MEKLTEKLVKKYQGKKKNKFKKSGSQSNVVEDERFNQEKRRFKAQVYLAEQIKKLDPLSLRSVVEIILNSQKDCLREISNDRV